MTWNGADAIRRRREQLGLSQSQVAIDLGVSKSYLSLVEAGKRSLAADQIDLLSANLHMPAELLRLSGGRLPEDVNRIIETDTASVVASIRQSSNSHSLHLPDVPSRPPSPIQSSRLRTDGGDIPETISVSKGTTAYRAHSYHTKVPPAAIVPFLDAFSKPGGTVFDPFCGSGMTGVAAISSGRNALLSDLSPAAVHIARNYTTYCDPIEFLRGFECVRRAAHPTIDWLYRPVGSSAIVEYTTWSDIFLCPSCDGEFQFWDAVQNNAVGRNEISCPNCGEKNRKSNLAWIGEHPVVSHTSSGNRRIDAHPPISAEIALINEVARVPIPYWKPNTAFGKEREMWRASHSAMGIDNVSDFFSQRNLHALACIRHTIMEHTPGRVQDALLFAFTACVNRASKRYQWNAKRPTNVMTGTLYISSLRYEWNVWSLFERKAKDVLRYFERFPKTQSNVQVYHRSATNQSCLADSSIDMVFMDPPFGSNIFYADSSLLWEAWLGHYMSEQDEIVINKHINKSSGGKNLDDYALLLTQSFSESARVLKVGGRAILVFSNSNEKIWQAVQDAVSDAGLDVDRVHVLDKGQPSIKGVKGRQGKENVTSLDLMLCLKHKNRTHRSKTTGIPSERFIDDVISASLRTKSTRSDAIYSAVIKNSIEAGLTVSGISMNSVAARCRALGANLVDDHWEPSAPLASSDSTHPDFIAGYLACIGKLPTSTNSKCATGPVRAERVKGTRSSPFYLAHSYHTKIPPEAIAPFIDHYTKPGDVILDPFAGSGMTGVAASMSGRRSILNDLSPAACHLAWNHTRPLEPDQLVRGFEEFERRISAQIDELYATTHSDRTKSKIIWTMWSTKHKCPRCRKHFLLWDAIDRESGRIGKHVDCPNCQAKLVKRELSSLGSEPAHIAYQLPNGRKCQKTPSSADKRRAKLDYLGNGIPWYPDVPMTSDREMYIRCALQLKDVHNVTDFYTQRNLRALAIMWEAINKEEDDRIKRALAFAFTNTAWHGTRMRRFNARGGQRPMTGTLYIPQLSSEANVFEVFRNKIKQLSKYYMNFQPADGYHPSILLGSADNLTGVETGSIDYVFTDPPFGSNIFYADCNFIWESWLGRLTDTQKEAVVNKSLKVANGGKSLDSYAKLIENSMREIHRVLKPNAWATIVFHNTNADVWQALHEAALVAGFEFHDASTLDRQQQSHKGYKGRSGKENVAHHDVIFNLQKSTRPKSRKTCVQVPDIVPLVSEIVKDSSVATKGTQGIHSEVMRRLASTEDARYVSYSEVRRAIEALQND